MDFGTILGPFWGPKVALERPSWQREGPKTTPRSPKAANRRHAQTTANSNINATFCCLWLSPCPCLGSLWARTGPKKTPKSSSKTGPKTRPKTASKMEPKCEPKSATFGPGAWPRQAQSEHEAKSVPRVPPETSRRLGLGHFGPVLGHLGLVLGLSWVILALSWIILGLSWAILG